MGGRGPFYYILLEKLNFLKDTLYEYLNHNFIISNRAAYTLPILFTPKPKGGWRFYINYQKPNYIPVKDKYLSLLIKEIFQRITKAMVFTKLNIWHAFYYMHIHPDLEELTAFRTCYRAYQYRVISFRIHNGPATF